MGKMWEGEGEQNQALNVRGITANDWEKNQSQLAFKVLKDGQTPQLIQYK